MSGEPRPGSLVALGMKERWGRVGGFGGWRKKWVGGEREMEEFGRRRDGDGDGDGDGGGGAIAIGEMVILERGGGGGCSGLGLCFSCYLLGVPSGKMFMVDMDKEWGVCGKMRVLHYFISFVSSMFFFFVWNDI